MCPKPRKPEKKQFRVLEFHLGEYLHEIQWNARFVLASSPGEPSRHLHTSIRPNFGPGGGVTAGQKISLLELIILALTAYWLLSFFGQLANAGIQHTAGFIDMLSVVIVVLIVMKFLS